MKNGKKPNRKQQDHIKSMGLNPDNWLISKKLNEEILLVHRETGTKKVIPA
ncbi:DUF6906 family protein [Fictibacillus sp. JL2B1089]|uniref:DUF6906 family protein n=1 Tax=Fictibacillus sp. JL2B1089 TaxID=3399565 RepID=UPI003A872661